jgi:predicted O-methyltransferase YrrM
MVTKVKVDKLYVMRDENYTKGLLDLIEYLKTFGDTRKMRMVEIGSYAGESTVIFANHFKEVIAIDPYLNDYDLNDITCFHRDLTKVYDTFLTNTKLLENIKLIKKTSDDAINDLKNETFDFVYIDGIHTYEQVNKDIDNYKPLIKKGGFIGGHDYHPVWDGVVKSIHEKVGDPNKTFQDTSWVIKII